MTSLPEQVNLFGEVVTALPVCDRDQLAAVLYDALRGLTLEQFAALLTNEFAEIIEYAELMRGEKACQKTSLLFNAHRLDTRTASSKLSLYGALQSDAFTNGLARACLFKHGKVSELLYQALQLGVNGVQYVNEFPPHIARDIYTRYQVNANSRILDPCGGWGGRMIGASVVCNYYECCEPSPCTAAGLHRLCEFIQRFRPEFRAEVRQQAFEDARLPSASFDIALTSPPYYDTERYSTDEADSATRYKSFPAWVRGFFEPLVVETMRALKPGAPFVLNIGSRAYPLNEELAKMCAGRFAVKQMGNLLSGNAGLGKSGEGEMFYEVRSL